MAIAAACVCHATAMATTRSGGTFSSRDVVWTSFPISSEPLAQQRTSRKARLAIITNQWGGGQYKIATLKRPRPGGCTLPEELAFTAAYGSGACYPARGEQTLTLIDQRLVPFKPVSTPPKFSALGRGADNLAGRRGSVSRAIESMAQVLRKQNPDARRSAMIWDAGLGLLENPLSSRATRRAVVRFLEDRVADGASAKQEDPRGRSSMLLTMNDRARVKRIAIGPNLYDLSDIRLRQDLYLSPRSFDIRASRTILTATTEPSLQDWLTAAGHEAVIGQRVTHPAEKVVRPSLRQRRVSCKSLGVNSDGVCIEIGKPGGRYVVTGG